MMFGTVSWVSQENTWYYVDWASFIALSSKNVKQKRFRGNLFHQNDEGSGAELGPWRYCVNSVFVFVPGSCSAWSHYHPDPWQLPSPRSSQWQGRTMDWSQALWLRRWSCGKTRLTGNLPQRYFPFPHLRDDLIAADLSQHQRSCLLLPPCFPFWHHLYLKLATSIAKILSMAG